MNAPRAWAAFDLLVGSLTFTVGVPVTLAELEFGLTTELLLRLGVTLAGGLLALAGVFLRNTPEPRVNEARILVVPAVALLWVYLAVGLYMTWTAEEPGLGTFAVIPAAIVVAATVQMIWLINQRPLTRRTGEAE